MNARLGHERGGVEEALRVLDCGSSRPTKSTSGSSPGGAAAGAGTATPLWITRGDPERRERRQQVLRDADDLVGGAHQQPRGGGAVGLDTAPWWVASTGGRRGPRASRAAAAAATVAFALCAWITCGPEAADERGLAQHPLGDAGAASGRARGA